MGCIKYLKNNILINQQTAFLIVLFLSFSFCSAAYSWIFTCHTWVAFSVLIVCISFCVVGGFFGFIFGMPKYVKSDSKKSDVKWDENTNLQEISDWATKIIVGIGLIQARSIARYVDSFSNKLSIDIGVSHEILDVIICGFFVVGFFSSYFWARLEFSNMINGGYQKQLDEMKNYSIVKEQVQEAFNALSDKTVSKESKHSYIPELDKLRKEHINATHRFLWIIRARFADEVENNPILAIAILCEFIANKKERNQFDVDMSDALYNKACYQHKIGKEGYISQDCADTLKESFYINESNREYFYGDKKSFTEEVIREYRQKFNI